MIFVSRNCNLSVLTALLVTRDQLRDNYWRSVGTSRLIASMQLCNFSHTIVHLISRSPSVLHPQIYVTLIPNSLPITRSREQYTVHTSMIPISHPKRLSREYCMALIKSQIAYHLNGLSDTSRDMTARETLKYQREIHSQNKDQRLHEVDAEPLA